MENKVALITGAGRGIGRTIAKTLASVGYDIIINYNKSKDGAYSLEKEINELYPNVKTLVLRCDISNELDVRQMVTDTLKVFSKVDVLVNNAAVCFDNLFQEKTVEEFKTTFDVNVIGTFLVSKYFGEMMFNNKYGKIINLTSTNGINTYYPMCIDYDASKSAIISLTHNLAMQFSPYVNVNAVAPGFISSANEIDNMDEEFISAETEKILVKRVGTEQDVANLVEFLASDKSNFINNEVIRIDGGVYGNF